MAVLAALGSARASRLGAGPVESERHGDAVPRARENDSMFGEVLQLWRGGPAAGAEAGNASQRADSPEVHGLEKTLRAAGEALGWAPLRALAEAYLPEVVLDPRCPTARICQHLAAVLADVVPPDKAREMLSLDIVDLVGAVCHWLEFRLQRMPWVDALFQLSFRELRSLMSVLDLETLLTSSKRPLVARILTSTSQDLKSQERLLRELTRSTGRPLRVSSDATGYLAECPEVVRGEVVLHAQLRAPAASEHYAELVSRLQDALAELGYPALKELVKKYAPEMDVQLRAAGSLGRGLIRFLPSVAPPAALDMMSSLRGAELVGAFCHWLGVRVQQTPWVEELRRMRHQELRDLVGTLGVDLSRRGSGPQLVAKIASLAADSAAVGERLARELRRPGRRLIPGGAAAVGYLDECPDVVRTKLAEQAQQQAWGAAMGVYGVLGNRLQGLLASLGAVATRALMAQYVPEAVDPSQVPIGYLVSLLPTAVPQQAALPMSRLDGPAFIAAVCYWLGARLLRWPWLPALQRLSARELHALMAKLGLSLPATADKQRLVARILAAASLNLVLLKLLVFELGPAVQPGDTEHAAECPEPVRSSMFTRPQAHFAVFAGPALGGGAPRFGARRRQGHGQEVPPRDARPLQRLPQPGQALGDAHVQHHAAWGGQRVGEVGPRQLGRRGLPLAPAALAADAVGGGTPADVARRVARPRPEVGPRHPYEREQMQARGEDSEPRLA